MNLTALKLRVQRTVGLDSSGAVLTDEKTLVEQWADEAALKFLMETKVTKRTAVLDLTASTGDYTLDADVLAFQDAYLQPADGSQQYMVQPVSSAVIRAWRLAQVTTVGPPAYMAYEGGMIMLYPTPTSSSDKLHIVYVPRPTGTFVGGGGTEAWSDATRGNIPVEYHDILEAYVKWKAAEYSAHSPSQNGQLWHGEWESGLAKAKIHQAKKAGNPHPVARVGRRGLLRFPIGNGIDVRY